jgi:hypothetical protein
VRLSMDTGGRVVVAETAVQLVGIPLTRGPRI